MSDTVEQIKSRLDIVDIISGYLKVGKAGRNYKARCPFHNEKTPSFYISPERQSWHCFGCNKGGDMFSFVQDIEGIEFVEAMRLLAARAGIEVPAYRSEDRETKSRRQALLAVTELSAKFFERQLWHGAAGARALAYLRERGLTDDTIRAWRIGWAPNDWRALTGFLTERGTAPTLAVAAGMAIDKNGRPYDRFRSRIMFPISDTNGQVVGFAGRVFGAEVAVDGEPLAKYVNTPQTDIYDKGKILFGLDKAKTAIRSRDACLLVEGNVDAILSWQAGTQNVVATSGTALTPHQLRTLGRYSTNLDMCFDTDQAGKVATRRGIGLALSQKFAVRILTITDPDCKDPADYVRKHGAAWNDVVATAKPALQYYYDEAVAAFDPTSPESKKRVVAAMGPLIRRLASKVEQGHWIGQIATLLRTDQSAVAADVATVKDDITVAEIAQDVVDTATGTPPTPLDSVGLELLAVLARMPALAPELSDIVAQLDPRVAAVIADPSMLDASYGGEHRHLIDVAVMRAEQLWPEPAEDQLRAHLASLVTHVRIRRLREQRAELERDIASAETARETERLRDLLAKYQEYSTQLNQLQQTQTPPTL